MSEILKLTPDLPKLTPDLLSAGMMLRYALGEPDAALAIDAAVRAVIDAGFRTGDIFSEGTQRVGTSGMGEAIAAAVR